MPDRIESTIKLKKHHNWNAPPGYRIFVADRGAVRFNIPQGWVIKPDPDSIKIYDAQEPDDNCRLAMSYLHLPPIDWSGLPLRELLKTAIEGDDRTFHSISEVYEANRVDIEVAWLEAGFTDPEEKREAVSRICLGRAANLQSLITFDMWVNDIARFAPVWKEVVRSLQLGRYIEDASIGDVVN